ncbi:LOW QUALITY PROTEIN: motilin receptor [Theristicus caerulescens]
MKEASYPINVEFFTARAAGAGWGGGRRSGTVPGRVAAAEGAEVAASPSGISGGGGKGSEGKPWPWLPCNEQLCLVLLVQALGPVMAVCLGLLAVDVVGSVLTELVSRGYCDMKPTTNLWLGSVAASDLLILLGLPFNLYHRWHSWPWIFFRQLLCRLCHHLSEGCTYCAILHITATAERYLAICFPLKATVVTKRRVKVIGVLWAFAFLSASPFFFLAGTEHPDNHTDFSRECKPAPPTESGLLATMFVTTSYSVLPVICLNVLYGFIGQELWLSNACLQAPDVFLWEKGHHPTIKISGESLLRCPRAGGPRPGQGAGLQHPQLQCGPPEHMPQPSPLQPHFEEVEGSSLQAAVATLSCRKGFHRNERHWWLRGDQC